MQGGRKSGLIISAAMVFAIVFLPAAVSAQSFNHKITVYASVAEQRAVYLDQSGNIVKIAGNTTENITPQVYDYKNQLIQMNQTIQNQYDKFLQANKNHLQASKIYNVNNLAVDTTPNNQTIRIDTSGLTLGSGRSG